MAKKIKHSYDDGGDVTFDSGDDLSPIDTSYATYMSGDNTGAPTASEIAAITGADSGALGNVSSPVTLPSKVSVNYSPDDVPSSSSSSNASGVSGAVSGILKALGLGGGNTSNTAILGALTGLLSAAGTAKNNQAKGTLPQLPVLPGSTSAPGYGPAGGYNFANYKGATAATPGVGFAPVTPTAAKPASSYYTYGQGPQQQQFQQVTGGAPITPLTQAKGGHIKMATGGHVSKYDIGGVVATPPPPPMSGVPNGTLSGALTSMMPPGATAPMPSPPSYGILDGGHAPGSDAPLPFQPGGGMGMPALQRPSPIPTQQPRPLTPQIPQMQRPQIPAPQPAPRIPTPQPAPRPQQPQQPPQPMQSIMAQRMSAARGMPNGGVGKIFADGGIVNAMTPNTAQIPGPQMVQSQGVTQGGNSLQKILQSFHRGPAASSHSPGLADGGALSQATTPPVEGTSRHITGPGDGTSDSIPARLANGEYVIDAQAVSMLGNGDNSAGAKRLDEFRRNLRQHKGQALAKGKMAPDAKPVHKYMGGK